MSRYRTIVAGTDGSPPSLGAVDRAAEVAGESPAGRMIVCACYPIDEREAAQAEHELDGEAFQVIGSAPTEHSLREAADRARVADAVEIDTVPVVGAPSPTFLLDVPRQKSADLLVVGSRGINTLKGRVLGSVPSEICRRADCDVLVARTVR